MLYTEQSFELSGDFSFFLQIANCVLVYVVIQESHHTLLASLRKKYSSSVAACAAAALLYQDWDRSPDKSIQMSLHLSDVSLKQIQET